MRVRAAGLADELDDEALDRTLEVDELVEDDKLLKEDEPEDDLFGGELEELDEPELPPHPAMLTANKIHTDFFQLIQRLTSMMSSCLASPELIAELSRSPVQRLHAMSCAKITTCMPVIIQA